MTSAAPPSEPKAVVRAARRKCAETQGIFAMRLGRCQGEISKYESGKVSPPGKIIMRCMNILNSNESTPSASFPAEKARSRSEKLGQSSPTSRDSGMSRKTPQISDPEADAWLTVDQAMQQLTQALAAARMSPQITSPSRASLSSTPTDNLEEPE